jgi:hypothetical protein
MGRLGGNGGDTEGLLAEELCYDGFLLSEFPQPLGLARRALGSK